MKRVSRLVTAAALLATASAGAYAQDTTMTGEVTTERAPLLGRPSFLLQPSLITTNFVSAPPGAGDRTTDFLARVTTVVPTFTQFLSLVALVQFTPFAGDPGARANSPVFVYGGIIPIIPPRLTGGWLSISIDPLGVYAPNNGVGDSNSDYKHYFFLEGAAVFQVGAMMFKDNPAWSGFGIHVLLDQQITGMGEDADRFNPILIVGATLPLGR